MYVSGRNVQKCGNRGSHRFGVRDVWIVAEADMGVDNVGNADEEVLEGVVDDVDVASM